MRRYFACLAVALATLWPAVPCASADPVAIQNGFFLAVPGEAMSLDLYASPPELFGSDVTATLRLFENVSSPPAPTMGTVLQPGDTIATTRTFEGSGVVFIAPLFPAEHYQRDLLSATFQFTGSDFLIPGTSPPPPVNEEDLYFVRQPFTMFGSFTFANLDGTASTRQISGQGTAILGLQPIRSTGASEVVSLGYSFEPVAPVPEPGTLFLCALGGLCGGGLLRRNQHT